MAGTIKLDDKTGKLISADLGINYDTWLKAAQQDLDRFKKLAERVERSLKSLGITNRPFKDADLKKLAGTPNAAALIKDYKAAQSDITSAHYAYDTNQYDSQESKVRNDLFDVAAGKTASKIKEVEKSIQDLKAELTKLEDQKKDLLAQIKKATEQKGLEFRKKFKEVAAEAKKLSDDYDYKMWDFNAAERLIKKK
jgi:predicted RNase H-like nuclease (RuvC/YqgF family)